MTIPTLPPTNQTSARAKLGGKALILARNINGSKAWAKKKNKSVDILIGMLLITQRETGHDTLPSPGRFLVLFHTHTSEASEAAFPHVTPQHDNPQHRTPRHIPTHNFTQRHSTTQHLLNQ